MISLQRAITTYFSRNAKFFVSECDDALCDAVVMMAKLSVPGDESFRGGFIR